MAVILLLIRIAYTLTSIVINKFDHYAGKSTVAEFEDLLGPNVPIHDAKGILIPLVTGKYWFVQESKTQEWPSELNR